MKKKLLKMGVAALVALAVPTAFALADGAANAQHGLTTAAGHAQGDVPDTVGAPDPADETTAEDQDTTEDTAEDTTDDQATSDSAGDRPQNHGWFVSQVATDHSTTGKAHGKAVSEVAKSDQGKPAAANH